MRERDAESSLELALKLVAGSETDFAVQRTKGNVPLLQKRHQLLEPDIYDLFEYAFPTGSLESFLGGAARTAEEGKNV